MIRKVGCLGCGGVLALFAVLLVISFIGSLFSGRQGAATVTSTPTVAPVRTDARLGSTRDLWITAYGEPRTERRGNEPMILGERFGTDMDVRWREGADGAQRASVIEVVLPRERPIAEAKAAAASLLPSDAIAVRTYTAPAGQTVEVFRSSQLSALFPGELFGEENPGTFIQIAERGSLTTARVVIGLGNNP